MAAAQATNALHNDNDFYDMISVDLTEYEE